MPEVIAGAGDTERTCSGQSQGVMVPNLKASVSVLTRASLSSKQIPVSEFTVGDGQTVNSRRRRCVRK